MKLIILLFLSLSLKADVKKIEKKYIKLSEVFNVYVYPGKPLHIEFPCPVEYALPGTITDFDLKVGLKKKNNLTVWAHTMSEIIGVTLRCGRKVISMDVISDKSKYQRYIKVLGFNSGHSNRVLINSSDKKLVPKKRERVLVKSSNGKGF